MSAPELVSRCFAARTAAHLFHLETGSYAEHMALGDFYDEIASGADKFVECFQGVFGKIKRYPDDEETETRTAPIPMIAALRTWLVDHRDECSKDESELENLVDELLATCDRTLYKLKYLK